MSTIINTPPSADSSEGGLGLILGVLIAIALIVLFVVYGLPALQQNQPNQPGSTNINVTVPNPTGGSTTSGSSY